MNTPGANPRMNNEAPEQQPLLPEQGEQQQQQQQHQQHQQHQPQADWDNAIADCCCALLLLLCG